MPYPLSRKRFLCTAALIGAALAPLPQAWAQAYPTRPVRLVVPFAPGGNTDVLARMVAQGLSESLGQPVVVENISGANGSIGASRVASAANDGYTLLFGTAGTQAINQSLYKNLSEKNLGDFEYIALVTMIPNVLVINEARTPVKSVRELVAHAGAQKTGMSYGSPGSGSTVHLSGELFKTATRLDMVHVPYKGSAPALTDLLGGQIDFIFENVTPALPFVQSGKLKALAVTSEQRLAALPDVPTMKESGYPGFVTGTWNGVLAPKGTPAAIVKRVEEATLKIAGSADFKTKVTALGGEVRPLDAKAFREFTRTEYQRWNGIVLAAKLEKQ
ncbi:Argininosuccinate lyase [Delftia tsuruhatensis]|uniref:Bug family tripartite tricarboxylate transporter substrate binding protein n=1 Tax=Delftia tsuruhatensis TaxID=180282 RepID=UPI001E7AECB8|nr:tripartite tricarboxylate transporter substrate binding protein [Delftia tsuruhatensis]CAB5673378.1 Argininosuccinate lyase [Delftia tsuruhatensis]CAC9683632.1 Argininosuccinate lyase [Delftia tsuruhatensis]